MKILEKCILILPHKIALSFGRFLGSCTYFLFTKRRKLALDNITLALGNSYTPSQRKKIIKRVFQHLSMNFIEFLKLSEITKDNLSHFVTFHNRELLEKVYLQKKGVLLLSGHIGNWELTSAALTLMGYNFSVIVKSVRQKSINDYITLQRTSKNIKLFSGKNIAKDILKQLKSGGIVGVVLDQHATKNESVRVPFFGRPANTYKSLAIFSERTGAPVIPIYSYRDENDHHHIVIEPEIISTSDDDTLSSTVKYIQWLESIIKKFPDQWIWTHNRWKTDK